MNIKIGELVEYVEDLKRSHERRVEKMRNDIQILLDIKKENEEELDGRAQLIDNLEKQVKVAEEVALQASADTRKEIDERLKQHYGFSTEDLRGVGVL